MIRGKKRGGGLRKEKKERGRVRGKLTPKGKRNAKGQKVCPEK